MEFHSNAVKTVHSPSIDEAPSYINLTRQIATGVVYTTLDTLFIIPPASTGMT
jgi:hypothetical protein